LVSAYCARPSSDAIDYELWDRNSGATDWINRDTDSFPFTATLLADVDPEISSTLTLAEAIDTDLVRVGMYAALESELVAITAIDTALNTLTVDRGVLDTIPVAHATGAYLWVHQGMYGLDRTERAVGETVEVKLLPSTAQGRLELSTAPTNTFTLTGRMMRPYPPGKVQVNGSYWPASIGTAAALALTWAHRDRTVQTVSLNRQDEGNIGPETSVTYTLRLYDETGTLKKTVTGLTGTSYTWSSEVADCGLGRLNTSLRFELESVRGTVVSLNKWDLTIERA
jgi:hypothetical protein